VQIVSTESNKLFDFDKLYAPYYQRMVQKLQERTGVILETAFFKWYVQTTATFVESASNGITLTITEDKNIELVQLQFFTLLNQNNILSDLHLYETNFAAYRRVLAWSIQYILGRTPPIAEVNTLYVQNALGLYNRDHPKFTNLFSWLHILYFGKEGRSIDIDLPFINAFRSVKYTLPLVHPRIAVLVSGHMRDYELRIQNHKVFTHNPYMDFFIHTWKRRGPRHEFHESLDENALALNWPITRSQVEDESTLLQSFSLRGILTPIFLHWGQQGDDATRYVTSKLYSVWKAFTLAQQFETEQNITYGGIMKLNVNVMYDHVDFKTINSDILPYAWGQAKNALYVPHIYPKKLRNLVNPFNPCRQPLTGGGCSRCDLEAKYKNYTYVPQHGFHHTDICETWWYANRLVGQKAAELYVEAHDIMQRNHAANLTAYPNCEYKQIHEFVYLKHPVQYQKMVYSTDDDPLDVVCFYPERLMREHMKGLYPCLSSDRIQGHLSEFDIKTLKA
jgi:hypothetical protein